MAQVDYQSKCEQLKREVYELQVKLRGMDYLEEDRRTLATQLSTAKKECDDLKAQNSTILAELEPLKKKEQELDQQSVKGYQLQIQAIKAQRLIATSDEEKNKDKSFREKYNLNEGDFMVTYYSCTDKKLLGGYLYLTVESLIFEYTLLGAGNRFTTAIKDIISLNKVKVHKFLPGKGASVLIKLRDGTVHELRCFMQRKETINKIIGQAKILGHHIEILRDGVHDINT
eukprot:TRINITY_DN6948_c0_g1_i1.p1 TRINITY_DN6948_c0_g1~~TRINITY_DN6948_c0_g1_i1.p1  ORF type:complete len:229 (-),score=58.75 TRINITY_DN6948_c0_g1_i1:210-896(-)